MMLHTTKVRILRQNDGKKMQGYEHARENGDEDTSNDDYGVDYLGF